MTTKKESGVLNCAQLTKRIKELEKSLGVANISDPVRFIGEVPKLVEGSYELLSDRSPDVACNSFVCVKTKHTVVIPEGYVGLVTATEDLKSSGRHVVSEILKPGEHLITVSVFNSNSYFKRLSKGMKIGELTILKTNY